MVYPQEVFMKSRVTVCTLLILFFTFSLLLAGTTGKIVGVVKDKSTGEPLIGVNVYLEGTTLGSSTDMDGSYFILNIPPGTYVLVAQYVGYQEVQVSNVKVSVDFTTRVDIEMQPTAIELGETIEVVAEREVIRKDLTSSQTEVTSEDISEIPAEEFRDILQTKAGITKDAVGGFHIRGGRSSEVAFWVDGVSVTDGFDGSVAVEVENNSIQSLQIISGTFNAEYGQAMSGIINIVTKEGGDKISGEVSSYVGDYVSRDKGNFFDVNSRDVFYEINDVSPTDLYDFRISLDGPIPFTSRRGRFFVNFRQNFNEGWLYGKREVNNDGTPGDGQVVPMNENRWYTLQSKLTFRLTDLMKLQGTVNWDDRKFREYDHFYKLNPDGDFTKFRTGINGSLTLDHTLSKRTFYTLKAARFNTEFQQYVFEDPSDPRYVDPTKFAVSAFQFSRGGQKNQHFFRQTTTNIIKFDITSQVTNRHLLKSGIETRIHRLHFLDFNVVDKFLNDTLYTPTKPGIYDPNYTEYITKPFEFSFYVQDKMEYEDFIVNVGVRFDYFRSNGEIPKDPKDPSYWEPTNPKYADLPRPLPTDVALELRKDWFKDPSPKFQISPRLGVAYPISARGVIHFSYGHFLQIPEFRFLYTNPNFRYSGRGVNNLFGNADLDAQRTVMYEVGLQQQLGEVISMDLTGFYRDIRNWVGTSPLQPTYSPAILYSEYENRDYANVRGITISVKKRFSHHFAGNLDYTFQVAEGNASNPEDAFNDIQAGREPRKTIIPLAWDRTHVLNGNIYIGFGSLGISLLGRFETGLPYTPNPVAGSRIGANISKGLRENSGRRPDLLTFDLQMYKDFYINVGSRRLKYSLFTKIYNLFDRRNEQGVWDDTGRATYTLQSALKGGSEANQLFVKRPDFYTEPRQIQFGMSLGF